MKDGEKEEPRKNVEKKGKKKREENTKRGGNQVN
jgi:hypothetical protein